jgi:class III poly(R)-hydroxyalkanoic acid synthase PhaE subunit
LKSFSNEENPLQFFSNLPYYNFGIFEKLFQIPSFGLTREYNDLVKTLFNDYQNYNKQVEKFKNIIAEQTKIGFEKFLQDIQKHPDIKDFDTFFKKWISKNEEIFHNFFKSNEYGTVLKELIKSGSQLKTSMNRYISTILKDTNIATKYELDRANEEIYNLKKEIKNIKKTLKELAFKQGDSK